MGRIYKGQSSLKITVKTYIDLTGAEECLIKYRKPDGMEGSFVGTISDEQEGIFNYEIKPGEIDLSGWWRFWAFVTFTGGRTAPGKSRKRFVWEEGE